MDNIMGFVMHGVEDVKDYKLDPSKNKELNSEKNFYQQIHNLLRRDIREDNIFKLSSSLSNKSSANTTKKLGLELPLSQTFSIPTSVSLENVVMNAEYVPHQEALREFLKEKAYCFDSLFSVSRYH